MTSIEKIEILQLILLILKFTGLINFSWWIVLLPTIILVTFALAIFVLSMLFLLTLSIIAYKIDK